MPLWAVLGGSWAVISMGVGPLIWVITIVTLLITPLITTHEPPSATLSELENQEAAWSGFDVGTICHLSLHPKEGY